MKKKRAPSARASLVRWCLSLGAAAATQTACQGVPVRPAEPSARTLPEPQDCPAEALKTMKTLNIPLNHGIEMSLRPDESVQPIPVREGPISVTLITHVGDLEAGAQVRGRLYFGEGRVYGRFTEAQTHSGETFKVCMELSQEGKRGAEMETKHGSTPDNVIIFSWASVKPVGRFE